MMLKNKLTNLRQSGILSIVIDKSLLENISKTLAKQVNYEQFTKKYAPVADVLKLVGAGVFLSASVVIPNLPKALRPFLKSQRKQEYEVWKRFNIPYLKRTLKRLEEQKLVEISEENGKQIVKITGVGQRRILRYAIDELAVEKPRIWNGKWILVSYDIPNELKKQREIFQEYLKAWVFYPLHESVYLHAYPCEKQVEFLRAYLNIGELVRIFSVSKIENDKPFKNYFGV